MTTQQVIDAQHEDLDSALDELQQKTERISHKVETALLAWLISALAIRAGSIERSPANVRTMRAIPQRFNTLMARLGYDAAVGQFLSALDAQYGVFKEVLASSLHAKMPQFTEEQAAYLSELRKQAALSLLTEADAISRRIMAGAMNTIGQSASTINVAISGATDALAPRVRVVAETSATTFYRTIAHLGYEIIERNSGITLQYAYAGPGSGDPVIRPFCKHLMHETEAGRTWTRAEIDAMNNGQLPNVFITCGGYNCRHTWIGSVTL